MSNSDDYQRDVAGRFMQVMRNKVFDLTHRLFPDFAAELTEHAMREVEEKGLQLEGIDVIRRWFRSDADAEWIEQFWQSPEGSRFLDLSVELMMRAMFRQFRPDVELPAPGDL